MRNIFSDKEQTNNLFNQESNMATKQDIQDLSNQISAISASLDNVSENAKPVDVVQDGNMHAVTSNAVADALGKWEEVWRFDSDNYILGVKNSLGTWLRIRFSGLITGRNISNGDILLVLPQEWRPVISAPNRIIIAVETPEVRLTAGLDIEADGNIRIYFQGNTPINGTVTVSGVYCDVFMNIR